MAMPTDKEKLISKFKSIREQALLGGYSEDAVKELLQKSALRMSRGHKEINNATSERLTRKQLILYSSIVAICALICALICSLIAVGYYQSMDPRCLIANNLFMLELARPAVSCEVCRNLTLVPTVDGKTFTKEMFLKDYAYNGIPLLVKGGALNWTALNTFSFNYLKDLFEQTEGALEAVEYDCQFFPYKTKFLSLSEVFAMSEARSRIDNGEEEWYVGWSNCNSDVSKQLRKHYKRPEFLPDDSESSNLDWLFMGGFGGGANIHIDYVQRPSWQAMIAGKKSWRIIPSPECDSICHTLNATMEKGDIILVDTNMWYHSTYIHPGQLSITIGSEYD